MQRFLSFFLLLVFMEQVKRVVIKDNKQFYWKSKDLHTQLGVIKENDLKTKNNVESHSGNTFQVFDANFLDQLHKIKRGPAVIIPKDAALIVYFSGIDNKSKVLDAGAGCGVLSASLARVAKEVISYEKREDFFKIAEANFKFLDVKNVKLKLKDVYEGIDEKNLDAVTLDLPEPWRALVHVEKVLKNGGTLITYLPTTVQVQEVVEKALEHSFIYVMTFETLMREWHVEGKKVRPKSQMLGHTAFISVFRKI